MADEPSRQTLDEVPGRILSFLIGVGTSLPVRTSLATKGYTQEEHDLGWSILRRIVEIPKGISITLDKKVQDAIAELDRWDEPNFAAIQAACARSFSAQGTFLFANLTASQGPAAVLGVETLLQRLEAFRNGPERKAHRKADHACLALLSTRGYTEKEFARLADLVKTAKTVMTVPVSTTNDEDRANALLEGYHWITDWGMSAKIVVTKKAGLISLGLATRKKAKKAPPPPPPPPVTTTPTAVATAPAATPTA